MDLCIGAVGYSGTERKNLFKNVTRKVRVAEDAQLLAFKLDSCTSPPILHELFSNTLVVPEFYNSPVILYTTYNNISSFVTSALPFFFLFQWISCRGYSFSYIFNANNKHTHQGCRLLNVLLFFLFSLHCTVTKSLS